MAFRRSSRARSRPRRKSRKTSRKGYSKRGAYSKRSLGMKFNPGSMGEIVVGGQGAYGSSQKKTMAHNTLIGQIPRIRNPNREGATQVRHREYICDVTVDSNYQGGFQVFDVGLKTGTSAAGIQPALRLNAGLAGTFPWLSQIARQYTQFQMNGCLVEFVSESSTSNNSGQGGSGLGTVMLSTQYNSAAVPFTGKQAMLNEEFAISGKPCQTLVHPIECARDQTTIPLLYTRLNATLEAGQDPQLYDLGQVTLAYQGITPPSGPVPPSSTPTVSTIGELWITYDMLLYKPQLTSYVSKEDAIAHGAIF